MHCPLKQFISNNEAAPIQFLLPPLSAVPHHYTNCRIYSARKTYPANKLNSFNLWLKYHQGDQGLYFFMYFLENWSAATLTFAMKVDSANKLFSGVTQSLKPLPFIESLLGLSFNVFSPLLFYVCGGRIGNDPTNSKYATLILQCNELWLGLFN